MFTNSCVEGTVRDAGDLDFSVLLAEDACAAKNPSGHAKALDYLDASLCHVRSTAQIVICSSAARSPERLDVSL